MPSRNKVRVMEADLNNLAHRTFDYLFGDVDNDSCVSSDNEQRKIGTHTSGDESDPDSQESEASSTGSPKLRKSSQKRRKLNKEMSSTELTLQTTSSCDNISKRKGNGFSANPEWSPSMPGLIESTNPSSVSRRLSKRLAGKSKKVRESPFPTVPSGYCDFYEDGEDLSDIIAQIQANERDEALKNTKAGKDKLLLSSDSNESSVYDPSSSSSPDSPEMDCSGIDCSEMDSSEMDCSDND